MGRFITAALLVWELLRAFTGDSGTVVAFFAILGVSGFAATGKGERLDGLIPFNGCGVPLLASAITADSTAPPVLFADRGVSVFATPSEVERFGRLIIFASPVVSAGVNMLLFRVDLMSSAHIEESSVLALVADLGVSLLPSPQPFAVSDGRRLLSTEWGAPSFSDAFDGKRVDCWGLAMGFKEPLSHSMDLSTILSLTILFTCKSSSSTICSMLS